MPKLTALSRTAIAVLVGMTVVLAPALAAAAAPEPIPVTKVKIVDFTYLPKKPTVEVGSKVRWTNLDLDTHDVATTKAPRAFASPALAQQDKYTKKFTKPGIYRYFCSFHPEMVATIKVVPKK
ncbi:MAG: cupredoxin domain-containing protein [Sporichthyaceae bacterium]